MARSRATVEQLRAQAGELIAVLSRESDLACVLVSASYLDQQLASLLEAFLIKGKVSGRLLAPSGEIGSFATRAALAYATGLIPKGLQQNLILIAEIRNTFAYHYLRLDFSDPAIGELVARLRFRD